MGLFSKKTVIPASTVINECFALGRNLKAHYSMGRGSYDDEFSHRMKVFNESGISKYHGSKYSNSPGEYITSELDYKIQERLGPVLSITRMSDYAAPLFIPITDPTRFSGNPDVVYIKLFGAADPATNTQVELTAIIPYPAFKKKYAGLRIGDRMDIDGPVAVEYSHNDRPFYAKFDIYVGIK